KYRNQLDYVLGELKHNPASRRIMTEIWVPEDLADMALTPCVHLTQWSAVDGKLYLEVRQRSCDVALGLVANVYQYSILHKLVALECGLKPAEIIWNIHNMHIYDRHMEKILEQVKRPAFEGATARIANFTSIYDFKPDDVIVENYRYGEKISYEIAI
ncbi:MAG: thymidylate synthase, partial [Fusobacteriaceae bacterium]|nr:thymidylate synthase [Fusobacteriaceae bacterium]